MTDQDGRGPGIDIVPEWDEVSDDDVTATTAGRRPVEEFAGEPVTSSPAPTSWTNSSSGSTVETVKEQSVQVGQQAADTGQHVATVAKEEAQAVVSEATDKARDLLGEAKTQLHDQLSTQQSALASVLRSLADELHDMVEQSGSARSSVAEFGVESTQSATNGLAGQAVREVSARASGVASWLEQREPGDVVDEVTRFARRRPGLFLVLAGAAGLVAGRFTRGLAGAGQDEVTTTSTPSRSTPAALLDPYPASTPIGAGTGEVAGGGESGSQWGSTHE